MPLRAGQAGVFERRGDAGIDIALQFRRIHGKDIEIAALARPHALPQGIIGIDEAHLYLDPVPLRECRDQIGIGVTGPSQHAQHLLCLERTAQRQAIREKEGPKGGIHLRMIAVPPAATARNLCAAAGRGRQRPVFSAARLPPATPPG